MVDSSEHSDSGRCAAASGACPLRGRTVRGPATFVGYFVALDDAECQKADVVVEDDKVDVVGVN